MIVEQRTYTLFTGKVPEYLRLYGEEGREIQEPILGHMVGWFTANDIGDLNQIVHLWAYDSLEHRAERRAALAASPAWQGFVAKLQPLIRTQESKILTPAPWSPVGGGGRAGGS
jgi:NIPSNAP protein